MLVNFLLWVKWVLTNAKTVLSFVITLKSAKKSRERGEPKERARGSQELRAPGWWIEAEDRVGASTGCCYSPCLPTCP